MAAAPVDLLEALSGASVAGADALRCGEWLRHSKRLRGWLDAFDASVTTRLDELARVGESFGSEDTHVNCSGISSREAAKLKNRSKTLDQADGFSEALASGTITGEHVDKLTNVANTLDDDVRASLFDHADDLLAHASSHDPARFGRHVRDLAGRLAAATGISRDRQLRDKTRLSWSIGGDGMYDIHARLHPTDGARLITAIDTEVAARIAAGEAAGDPDCVDRTVNRAQIAAEVLVDYVTGAHHQNRPIVADISLLVDATTALTGDTHDDTISETSHGVPVPIESIRTLLCSGRVTPVIVGGDGTVLNIGRTRRTPNRAQRRALRAMYRTCAAAGCDTTFERCELHHITPWEHGGATDLQNLLPVCSRHHHMIHAHSWQLDLAHDRTLTVTDRHGNTVMITTPDMPCRTRSSNRRTGPAPAGEAPTTESEPLAG